jgi:hypothetical protein
VRRAAGKPLTWRERGRGEVRCNVRAAGAGGADAGSARLLMRAAGHLRLLLNAALYPGMVIATMDGGKGLSFACLNAADAGADAAAASAGAAAASGAAPAAEGGGGAAAAAEPLALRTFAVRLRGADAEERTLAFKAAVEEAVAQLPRPKAGAAAAAEPGAAAAAGADAV